MSALNVRRATAADLPAIVALLYNDELGRQREILSDPPAQAYVDAFAAIERDPNQFLAVCETAERLGIAGCLQLSFIPGLSHRGLWRGQIESVRIAASHRGLGLGRAFISWAVEACRERGCGMVQLTSTASRLDARRFYESLGFEATHTGFKLDLRD